MQYRDDGGVGATRRVPLHLARVVWSHLITSRFGAPLLLARDRGLLVEVTDGLGYGYRGSLYYSLVKISVIHLAKAMAEDFRAHGVAGVTVLAVTPGYLPSEAMLDGFGVTEALRPYTVGDAPALWEAAQEDREAHLAPWMSWARSPSTLDETRQTLIRMQARWLLREDLAVGIFERATGRYLGGSGLHRIDWDLRAFEIGYWLRKSAVGYGYGSEAVQVLTRFAFDTLEANRVEIRMYAANAASRRVPERLGFVFEGRLRNRGLGLDGRPADGLVFALIPEDYRGLAWATPG